MVALPAPHRAASRVRSTLKERATILKAMAHPSRLLMLEALANGERCVCELQRLVGADISTVSKHLALMRSAGLVLDRREGLQIFYSLRVPCVTRFFDCVDAVRAATPVPLPSGRRGAPVRQPGQHKAAKLRRPLPVDNDRRGR